MFSCSLTLALCTWCNPPTQSNSPLRTAFCQSALCHPVTVVTHAGLSLKFYWYICYQCALFFPFCVDVESDHIYSVLDFHFILSIIMIIILMCDIFICVSHASAFVQVIFTADLVQCTCIMWMWYPVGFLLQNTCTTNRMTSPVSDAPPISVCILDSLL